MDMAMDSRCCFATIARLGCDKSLIIKAEPIIHPRNKPPGQRAERPEHKLPAENQLLT